MTQTTIRKLTSGEGYGSKYLHLIARALGTTPAYLSGETDDRDEDAPTEPELSREERQLIDSYAVLDRAQRAAVLALVKSMSGSAATNSVHAPGRAYAGQPR